jgi:hypothetical protein
MCVILNVTEIISTEVVEFAAGVGRRTRDKVSVVLRTGTIQRAGSAGRRTGASGVTAVLAMEALYYQIPFSAP